MNFMDLNCGLKLICVIHIVFALFNPFAAKGFPIDE